MAPCDHASRNLTGTVPESQRFRHRLSAKTFGLRAHAALSPASASPTLAAGSETGSGGHLGASMERCHPGTHDLPRIRFPGLRPGCSPAASTPRSCRSGESIGITLDLCFPSSRGYRILEIQEVSAATVDAATRAAIDRSAGGSGRKPVAAGHFLGASAEATVLVLQGLGRVAEWFKAAVLKTAVGATPPWVRIPPLPPNSVVKLLCLLK